MNLVCGLPAPFRQRRLLAMLQGYFDDSGSEPQSFAFVIAGYILSSEQMAAFADDWLIALHQKPRIEYFKMAEAFGGYGQFAGIQTEFRKAKVRDMIAVIYKHKPRGIASFFNWDHFKAFSRYLPEELKGQPYAPLFFRLIDNVLEWQKSIGAFPEKIQLDFDDQGKAGEFAIEWYGRMMNNAPPLSFSDEHRAILEGTPRMLNDQKYVPLQAADMAAWVVRNGGTPGLDISGWEWLDQQIGATVWQYSGGFSEEYWNGILDQIVGPRRVILK